MAFHYEVEQWSTGQIVFKIPGKDSISRQDLPFLPQVDVQLLSRHISLSSSVLDLLNRRRLNKIPFTSMYVPGLESFLPYGWNHAKAQGGKVLHRYTVDREDHQVKFRIDLSQYTDPQEIEEALDLMTGYAHALAKWMTYPALNISIEAYGPHVTEQIAHYQETKKVKMIPKPNVANLEILMGVFIGVAILSSVSLLVPAFMITSAALAPFFLPALIVSAIVSLASYTVAIICAEITSNRENDYRIAQAHQEIAMSISPSLLDEPSVFSNSSAAGLSVLVDPNVNAPVPGEMAPGPGEAAPGAGETVKSSKKFK